MKTTQRITIELGQAETVRVIVETEERPEASDLFKAFTVTDENDREAE